MGGGRGQKVGCSSHVTVSCLLYPSPVSCLVQEPAVSCTRLLSPICQCPVSLTSIPSRLSSPVICLRPPISSTYQYTVSSTIVLSPVSHLLSCFTSPVFCVTSPVLIVLSPVSCTSLLPPIFFPIYRVPSSVSCVPLLSHSSHCLKSLIQCCGAGAVKKGAAAALQLKLQLWPHV